LYGTGRTAVEAAETLRTCFSQAGLFIAYFDSGGRADTFTEPAPHTGIGCVEFTCVDGEPVETGGKGG